LNGDSFEGRLMTAPTLPYLVEIPVPSAQAARARTDLVAYLEERAGLKHEVDWMSSERAEGATAILVFALKSHARSLLFKVAAAVLLTPDHPATIQATAGPASGHFVQPVRAQVTAPAPAATAVVVSAPLRGFPIEESFHFG
jgi:hypothetical protein